MPAIVKSCLTGTGMAAMLLSNERSRPMCRVCEGGIAIDASDQVVGNREVGLTEAVSGHTAAAEGRVDMASGWWCGERQDRRPGKAKTVSPRAGRSHYSSVR